MSFVDHDPRILEPSRFFGLIDVATGLFVVWGILLVTGMAPGARPLIWLSWATLLFVLFFRRGQDEFWIGCWRKATSAAFLGLLVVPILWAFGLGLYEGFTTEHAQDVAKATVFRPRKDPAPSLDTLVAVLFTIFFARFQWTRFRGGLD